MDVTSCLARIRYEGGVKTDEATLRRLHRSFLLSVPFENLDIRLGRHIAFTLEAVFNKVIARKRGGFCYELNSLFHDLLQALGFDAQFHGARMMREGRPGVEMGHMVLTVNLGGERWLADVGNGKSTREPLRMDGANQSSAEGIDYRVRESEAGPVLMETVEDGQWKERYLIDPKPKRREDFTDVCEWTQTSSESKFTQVRLCTLARPKGRALLVETMLTLTDEDQIEEREIDTSEYAACLKSYFGLSIDI